MTAPEDLFDVSAETGWPVLYRLAPPSNPMAVAREILDITKKEGVVSWWRGDFYQWTGTHWEVWPDVDVNAWLYRQTEHAIYRVGGEKPVDANWAPTRKKINDLADALGVGVLQRPQTLPSDDGDGTVAFINGVLDLATMELLDHTAERFNLYSLRTVYSVDAPCTRWLAFLEEVLEADADRIAILQEWFGYVLCGGTELQKIFSMFGPKRCGKGTILRVLTALIGQRYVASPSTLDSLAGAFGEEQLLGARLAILGDVQWTGNHVNEAVGILLGISGEDAQTVQRKHRVPWTGLLPVRFMLAGNDRPKFRNASGALAGRLIHLQFRVSMYGREDPTLTAQLLAELSGIFNWALEGWRRLQAQNGRFTESELAKKAAEEVERSSSPVTAFVRDMCVTTGAEDLDFLYREYEKWRARESLGDPMGKPSFSRDLQSALPMVSVERAGRGADRRRVVKGLRLRYEGEGEDDVSTAEPEEDSGLGCTRHVPGTYPAQVDDLTLDVFPGPGLAVPGVPGVPGISSNYRSENLTSAESTSRASTEHPTLDRIDAAIGKMPGTPGTASEKRPLTSTNAVPGIFQGAGYTFDPTLWDGDPLIEPHEAA